MWFYPPQGVTFVRQGPGMLGGQLGPGHCNCSSGANNISCTRQPWAKDLKLQELGLNTAQKYI